MSKYVVKIGELYSCGGPTLSELGGYGGLQMSSDRKEAWVTKDRELATKHAVVWTGDALAAGTDIPRVVRLKGKRK